MFNIHRIGLLVSIMTDITIVYYQSHDVDTASTRMSLTAYGSSSYVIGRQHHCTKIQ